VLSALLILYVYLSDPAGLCALHLENRNSSSVTVSWDSAPGEFNFHRITVTNASVTNTLIIPKEERVAVVTGLLDGCSYNVSTERVRGLTAGKAAFLIVTTGRCDYKGATQVNSSFIPTCPHHVFIKLQKLSPYL